MNKKWLKSDALLLLAAAIWGFAFVAQRAGMRHMGPFFFNAIRFGLGSRKRHWRHWAPLGPGLKIRSSIEKSIKKPLEPDPQVPEIIISPEGPGKDF